MVTMLDWDFTNLFKTLFTGHFGHFQGPSFEKSRWPRMALQWRSGALNSGPAGDVPGEAVLPVMWISLRILYIHGYVSYGGRFTSTWVWINTYRYIFSGLFTSIDPSYFDVNRRGTRVFDPYRWDHRYGCQRLDRLEWDAQPKKWTKNHSWMRKLWEFCHQHWDTIV